jgi:hypothetical protein
MTTPLKKRVGDKMSPTEQMVTKCYVRPEMKGEK